MLWPSRRARSCHVSTPNGLCSCRVEGGFVARLALSPVSFVREHFQICGILMLSCQCVNCKSFSVYICASLPCDHRLHPTCWSGELPARTSYRRGQYPLSKPALHSRVSELPVSRL